MLEVEHKGYTIRYEEWGDEGFFIQTPRSGPYTTLGAAKQHADKLARKKYIEEKVFLFDNYQLRRVMEVTADLGSEALEIIRATATRPHNMERIFPEFWAKRESKKGTAMSVRTESELYRVCPENDRILPKLVDASIALRNAATEFRDLYKQLVPLKEMRQVQ